MGMGRGEAFEAQQGRLYGHGGRGAWGGLPSSWGQPLLYMLLRLHPKTQGSSQGGFLGSKAEQCSFPLRGHHSRVGSKTAPNASPDAQGLQEGSTNGAHGPCLSNVSIGFNQLGFGFFLPSLYPPHFPPDFKQA